MKKSLILLFLPIALMAQKKYDATLDSFMQAHIAVNHFNGNILIARSGTVIYQKAFGFRNYDTKELLDNNTVFELASVSKQFTAMGILLLKEKGLLSLSDTLRKFFPELPYKNVTIKNLLTHTAGLPDYMDAMAAKWDHKKVAFNNDVINFLATEQIPPNFEPGTKWEYSNTAYEILASIIEKISGMSFKDYMQKEIFGPLDMRHSRVYNTRRSTKETIPNYAYGYVYSDSLKRYVLPDSLANYDYVIYLDGIQGDGIINSTTGDLMKWDKALESHKLLGKALQDEMLSPQSIADTAGNRYYGYGVLLGKSQFGDYISHEGTWPGYRTILTRFLQNDITVIVLSNNESDPSVICTGVAAILNDKTVIRPYIHKEMAIDPSLLSKYIGVYKGGTIELNVIMAAGKLYRHREGSTDIELKPESERKLFYGDGSDRQVEYETDKNGSITRVWFISGGLKTELRKSI